MASERPLLESGEEWEARACICICSRHTRAQNMHAHIDSNMLYMHIYMSLCMHTCHYTQARAWPELRELITASWVQDAQRTAAQVPSERPSFATLAHALEAMPNKRAKQVHVYMHRAGIDGCTRTGAHMCAHVQSYVHLPRQVTPETPAAQEASSFAPPFFTPRGTLVPWAAPAKEGALHIAMFMHVYSMRMRASTCMHRCIHGYVHMWTCEPPIYTAHEDHAHAHTHAHAHAHAHTHAYAYAHAHAHACIRARAHMHMHMPCTNAQVHVH